MRLAELVRVILHTYTQFDGSNSNTLDVPLYTTQQPLALHGLRIALLIGHTGYGRGYGLQIGVA